MQKIYCFTLLFLLFFVIILAYMGSIYGKDDLFSSLEKNDKITHLVKQLQNAKKHYYSLGDSPLSDSEFDALEDELRQLAPKHAYFQQVGFPSKGKKIVHRIPMLSADKCKKLEDIDDWLKRLDTPELEFVIEPKIDGLSATCCYQHGQLQYVATRGDGKVGQDVRHIAQYMDDIPKSLPQPISVEVRGELYLPQDTAFDTKGKPLRNNCVGLINRKEEQQDLRYVHFAAYQVLGETHTKESDAVQSLEAWGFRIVPLKIVHNFDDIKEYYQLYLNKLRYAWSYETDGLMIIVNDRRLHPVLDARWVVGHHHHYQIAFKPPAEAKETPLQSIEWQISRQGNLIPVAVFAPIQLGNAMLERATLHNFDTVKKNSLALGDTLLIARANDVIPYVKENLSHHQACLAASELQKYLKNCPLCVYRDTCKISSKSLEKKFIVACASCLYRSHCTSSQSVIPTHCWSCGRPLEICGMHLHCPNAACIERQIAKVVYWVSCCQMENMSEATVRQLFDRHLLQGITDLYKITEIELAQLDGFAEKKIHNFMIEVAKSRRMSASEFIGRLGIPLVQQKSVLNLGLYSLADFWAFDKTDSVIGRNLIAWRDDLANKALVEELVSILDIYDTTPHKTDKQKRICCTGTGPLPRSELARRLFELGYIMSNTVTKETEILLCENANASSTKLDTARNRGVKIQSYADFFQENGIELTP